MEDIYTSVRLIDGKPRKVIVNENRDIINNNPNKEDLIGLDAEPYTINRNKVYTNKKLLEYLRQFYEKKGRVPVKNDFDGNPRYPSSGTYVNRFGSWNNALIMAELFDNRVRQLYTDKELLEYMRQFDKENGRIPVANDFNNNPKYPNCGTYVNRFGSWNNAIIRAGLKAYHFIGLEKEELLGALKQFYEENGRAPMWDDFSNNPKYPSITPYIDQFGGFEIAKNLIGLGTDSMVRKGIIETNKQKARLAELYVLEHFVDKGAIDLSGKNFGSFADGISPKHEIYDVRSLALVGDNWPFSLKKGYRNEIEWFYLLAFNKDWTKLLYVWRIPGNFVDGDTINIGFSKNREYNIENMKEFEITDKFKDIDIFK